ncbi:MAG: hypothetical protein B6I35_13895 [Anaerolineaceae bacterium 4572_32.2]|nr:MAG: hypothetical protein B6I35_13895 [Anaerolineaceae bacterium 4572_32.2]
MFKKVTLLLLTLIVTVPVLTSCGGGGASTIKIGLDVPMTGDIAYVGTQSQRAAEMMVADINDAGGLGPQSSKQAVPTGEVCNENETPMVSPWSTNPNTTLDRPWVFRGCFLDPFQGPVAANFATDDLGFTKAAVLYDVASDYPKGLAEFFTAAWEDLHGAGSVVAYESFTTGDTDLYFSTHYAAEGATGATKEFIDRYTADYGEVPGDVAALTWDAMGLVIQAIQNTGGLSGDLAQDRAAVKDALGQIKDYAGITGNMTFTPEGDPIKCAVLVQIKDGAFTFYKQVCP